MDTTRLKRLRTPDSANKGRNGLGFKCSKSKKKKTKVKTASKIVPADQSQTICFQQFIPITERNDKDWNATPTKQDREPYQPLCEPLTPEPPEGYPKIQMPEYPIVSDDRMMEFLDTMVILSRQYEEQKSRSLFLREKPDYST